MPQLANISYWQWLTLVGTLLAAAVVAQLIGPLIVRLVKFLFRRFHITHHTEESLPRIGKAAAYLLAALALEIVVPLLNLPADTRMWTQRGIDILVSIFGLLTAYRTVDVFVEHFTYSSAQGKPVHSQLVPLIRRMVKVVIFVFGVIVVLEQFSVNLTALVAGLSIGGAALALASQDTIRNLFGSFMIMTDRPFTLGDQISVQGAEGVVEDIGLRSTRIRTPDNSIVSIPNGRLADMTIDNLGLRVKRRYRIILSAPITTTPEQVEGMIAGLRTLAEQHPLTQKDEGTVTAALTDFTDLLLKITFQVFLQTNSSRQEMQAKQEINIGILRLMRDLGITMAAAQVPPPSSEAPPGAATAPFSSSKEE